MIMNITSKHMHITPAIRRHIIGRMARLQKWQAQLINPHIILSKQPQGFTADATIGTPDGALIASASNSNMYVAISELINKLSRQLDKARHKPLARRASSSVKEIALDQV